MDQKQYSIEELTGLALEIRRLIVEMACRAGGSHIASAFSIVEILSALYFGGILKYDPSKPQDPNRDRFILSKGHAGTGLYAILAKAGFFPEKDLNTYCQAGTNLGGHPNMHEIPGVEASTGALGHGFPYGVGIALGGKMECLTFRVYVVLGDGECQEGTIWEAALFAAHQRLRNLVAIIDHNKLQAMEPIESIVSLQPLAEKWRAFGWKVFEVNGHDIQELVETFQKVKQVSDAPQLIIAHTTKGKGVSFMENVPIWHYRLPNQDEMKIVCEELKMELK